MYLMAPLSSRNQFGQLLNERGLTGEAVEVGTHRGQFARILLSTWKGRRLHCVDPWSIPAEYQEQVITLDGWKNCPPPAIDRDTDYERACQTLQNHQKRVSFLRLLSATACGRFADNSLDFVFVDGDHRYQAVLEDLTLWWPKLRPGGIMAGHDIVCPGEVAGGYGGGVQRAVRDFCRASVCPTDPDAVPVQLIVEENGHPWSFYLEKEKS